MIKMRLLGLMTLLSIAIFSFGQVTTGTLTGVAKSDLGEPLIGATITALHTPTGSKYASVAKSGGQYTLPNLRIGGPYIVTVSFKGFADAIFNDLYVGLGNPLVIDAALATSSQALTGVTVTGKGKGSIISSQRNGTSTNVSLRQLQSLPTINRNVQDFARLSPQVKAGTSGNDGNGSGLSFAGQSNRYNQFSIDGANASDAFGLGSTGTNGGQANVNPISIEAIQEVQIVLSPYDVTQGGFTGGGINAVTKSGTNTLHGSAYGNYQNEGFIGKSNAFNKTVTRNAYPDFKNQTFGASLGGAIVKNKLFFFASYERFEKSTPIAFDPTVAGSGSRVSVDTLKMLKDFMLNKYGYDLGSYGAINNKNQSNSVFARIDWNISTNHKLTLRHSFVDGSNDIRSRSATTALFENTGYKFTTKSNTSVLELNSTFNSSASNIFRVTYNRIRDRRISNDVPNIFISSYDNNTIAKTRISYNLGSDFSSAANSLDQDIVSVTDNFNLYKGKHTLTFGTNNEFFKSENVFLQAYYGAYTYNNTASTTYSLGLSDFMNNTGMTQYQIGYGTKSRGDKAIAELKTAQLSAYVQDVWATSKNFKLTYGLRVDLPIINSEPAENADFNTKFAAYNVKTNLKPETKLLFSPRVGFNYNVEGTGDLQIRGGLGLFTGRVPFVWISNQFSNTGVTTKNLTFNAAQIATNNIKFVFDKNDPQLGAFIPASTAPAATVINVIDKNFKYPQVLRANFAADKKLGAGFIATFEAVFTKNINNAFYSNLNISANGESTVAIGPTTRPFWNVSAPTSSSYSQVIKLSNTSKGASFNFTTQVQKQYSKGWAGSLAYSFGFSNSLNDIPSSVAVSNWRGAATVNGLNKLDFTASNFDLGSRVTGFLSKEFKYAGHFATTFTVFYTGQTGQRISYLYSALGGRNITNDDASTTSVIYIPKTAAEANFADFTTTVNGVATVTSASQQWTDFQAFSASNKYFARNAGKNAERNGDKLPWENHFDVRIAQDFLVKNHKLQIFFDVINAGALLNNDWGRSYVNGGTPDGFFPLSSNIFAPVVGTTLRKDGVLFTATANTPAFQFNINNFTKIDDDFRPYNVSSFTSRWTSQLGVRYSF